MGHYFLDTQYCNVQEVVTQPKLLNRTILYNLLYVQEVVTLQKKY